MSKVDYYEYINSPEWKAIADRLKEAAGYRCRLCNSKGELHTHHRTYERLGDERDKDLIVLCANCHEKFHKDLPDPPARIDVNDNEYVNVYRIIRSGAAYVGEMESWAAKLLHNMLSPYMEYDKEYDQWIISEEFSYNDNLFGTKDSYGLIDLSDSWVVKEVTKRIKDKVSYVPESNEWRIWE